jgi:hypothetical protein
MAVSDADKQKKANDKIYEKIAQWNRSDKSKDLIAFLGMTRAEFKHWGNTGEAPNWMLK